MTLPSADSHTGRCRRQWKDSTIWFQRRWECNTCSLNTGIKFLQQDHGFPIRRQEKAGLPAGMVQKDLAPLFENTATSSVLRCHFFQKLVKIIPERQFDVFPIIQPCSLHFAAVKGETQGFDEMQKGAGGKAGAPDISGIPVYFRSYQNNVTFQLLLMGI